MPNKRILIAEDERAIAEAMKAKLVSTGYEVDLAKNGEEAIDLLKKNHYNLLLLDLVMPDVDGFETLERMKGLAHSPKVIVSTNLSQPEDESRAKALGAVDFLVKSNTPIAELVKIVDKHCS